MVTRRSSHVNTGMPSLKGNGMTKVPDQDSSRQHDPLTVLSVEKAFRVLSAFDSSRPSLSLTQLAAAIDLDKSATQRFTHTLVKLGYLTKDLETKRFELTAKTLDFAYNYTRANALVDRAKPYLMQISMATEETVNLTVMSETDVIIVSRIMSRHVLNTDVVVGTRIPAFCTASGVAMMSCLTRDLAEDLLRRSDLKPYTASTTFEIDALMQKLLVSSDRGYATSFEEFYHGDLSVAAAIQNGKGKPIGGINIAVSRARFTPREVEEKFAPLVIAAARSVSKASSG